MGRLDGVGDAVRALVVRDGLAYLAAGSAGLVLVDVAEPHRPRQLSSVVLAQPAVDVALLRDWVVVATGLGGLRIVEVRNPVTPREIAAITFPGPATAVAVASSLA